MVRMQRKMQDSSGIYEHPQAQLRRLTALPAETEHHGTGINRLVPQQHNLRKKPKKKALLYSARPSLFKDNFRSFLQCNKPDNVQNNCFCDRIGWNCKDHA